MGEGKAVHHEKELPYSAHYTKLNNCLTFEVTKNHLKLIKRNVIEWSFFSNDYCEGYFYQDMKRPYGNSAWIEDIGEILGIKPDRFDPNDKDDKWYSVALQLELVKYHIDMKIVMQILCVNLSIKAGTYKRSVSYDWDWKLQK